MARPARHEFEKDVIPLKKFVAFLLAAISILLCSCNFDRYDGKRPFDYGAAKWVCEEPTAWFVVNPDAEDYYSPKGEVTVNDETLKFELIFVHETNTVFFNTETSEIGFDGECEFSSEKLIIKVDKQTDTLFGGRYDELVFVREADGDSESSQIAEGDPA